MGDFPRDHLGLAGAADTLGARGHHGDSIVEKYLNDAPVARNHKLCARTVQDDGEFMVTRITGGVDWFGGKAFNVWDWPAKSFAGLFNR